MRRVSASELLSYLVPVSQYEFPMSLEDMFGSKVNRVILEIGIGNGGFLLEMASRAPEYHFIGVERSLRYLKDAVRRFSNAGITNVKLFEAYGEMVVRDLLPDSSINEVYVNFPDPWPKKAHVKRRLLNRKFLKVLSKRLKLGGTVYLVTDHAGYRDWVLDEVPRELYKVHWGVGPPFEMPITKYMRKWRAIGREIYHVILSLREVDPTPEERLRRVKDMIQVKFSADLTLKELLRYRGAVFKVEGERGVEAVLKVLDVIAEPDRAWMECLLVEVTSLYNLEQRALVKLSLDDGGWWWLRSEPIGQLILTPNSLKLFGKLLEALEPKDVAYSNLSS